MDVNGAQWIWREFHTMPREYEFRDELLKDLRRFRTNTPKNTYTAYRIIEEKVTDESPGKPRERIIY